MTALRDLAELVRAPAALSVPGDVAAGAAAGRALGPRTLGLACSSVCLYWAGMAANDWADRHLDAAERPERPIPSGRVRPGTALGVAAGLTAAGLTIAGLTGGRRALAVAVPLAGAIWAYDLAAKNTRAGPLVMAVCRGLDVLLGATPGPSPQGRTPPGHRARGSTRPRDPAGGGPAPTRPACGSSVAAALPADLTVAAHTYLLTGLSLGEASGTARYRPAATLAGTVALAATTAFRRTEHDPEATAFRRTEHDPEAAAFRRTEHDPEAAAFRRTERGPEAAAFRRTERNLEAAAARAVLASWYASQFGTTQARAVADPSPQRVRDAVTAGIVSLPALQGALVARAGAPRVGLALAAMVPLARRLARKLSPT